MKELRVEIRLIKNEKTALGRAARDMGMSISDYIRYRLFENNPETNNVDYIYETPGRSKHDYLSMGVLLDIFHLLSKTIINRKGQEDAKRLLSECRELTKNRILEHGYLKMSVKDE